MLEDILQDTPAFQQIFAQGEEKGIVKGIEKGRQQERQEIVQTLRLTLLTLVAERFPKLKRLAKGQLSLVEQPQTLEDLFLKIALANTQEDAQNYLLHWEEAS